MTYRSIRGSFLVDGLRPDGDTIRFRPDRPALVEQLERFGSPPDLRNGSLNVRLEGIDALETHFGGDHQELTLALAARDALLREVGFESFEVEADDATEVASARPTEVRGHVLASALDVHGRPIVFVSGDETPPEPDGAEVFLEPDRMAGTVNGGLVRDGLAYPAFYTSLPADLRGRLTELTAAARGDRGGMPRRLWEQTVGDPDTPAVVREPDDLSRLVMWPKLFRRLSSYFAAGHVRLAGFPTWLRANGDDRVLVLVDDPALTVRLGEIGNLHDLVAVDGDRIQLLLWPDQIVVVPAGDEAVEPRPASTPPVVLVAALPDPVGEERGAETVTVLNVSSRPIDLTGWQVSDGRGADALDGTLGAGDAVRVVLDAVRLANSGDVVRLLDANAFLVDEVSYDRVREGRTVVF